ncbi:hypothetical protein CJ179_50265 [Rhodococcus sp. ACS1]|uniref:hypothetical protein n=1 Tax=Rhodococcus sp. ACS1 TaxID=2028570 RepID=UPI000BB0DF73|nr:hypothetical protein [Rhodococcus sp. ACS1]PBC35025.1 hypothetical protein CJ179_50265 [Rhodococcus sp. ACS1]
MTSTEQPTVELSALLESTYGHDGHCDHDDGHCPEPIRWILAEATEPSCVCGHCVDGPAALAYYCDTHIALYPAADRDDIESNAAWRPNRWLWTMLADTNPIRIHTEQEQPSS